MANKLANLLRKVFLGSLAAIVSTNTTNAITPTYFLDSNESEKLLELNLKFKPDLTRKLILKKANNDEWTFMSHRSHRSHQSHRSHYSSQGSGHISHFSHYSSSTGGGSMHPNSSNYYNNSTGTSNSSNYLSLGSRNLSLGKSGTDVTELINKLIKKGYLSTIDDASYVTGINEYDNTVRDAIKRFQRDNGLQVDGICGPTTIYYLKKK